MRQKGKTVSPMSNEGRNQYVVEHITEALLKLLQRCSLEDISISRICEEAGVGRASFYRNFESKAQVLERYLARLMQEWGREFEARGEMAYFSESLLRHYYKHRDFYLLLYRQGLSGMIYETIRRAAGVDQAENNMERYGKSMFAGMIFGWADEWMRRGMPETPEEILILSAQGGQTTAGQH